MGGDLGGTEVGTIIGDEAHSIPKSSLSGLVEEEEEDRDQPAKFVESNRNSLASTREEEDDIKKISDILEASPTPQVESGENQPIVGIESKEDGVREIVKPPGLMRDGEDGTRKVGEDQLTVGIELNDDGIREGLDLRESFSGLRVDGEDQPMVGVESKKASLDTGKVDGEDQAMVGVESKKASLDTEKVDGEDQAMVGVESKKALLDSEMVQGEDQPMAGVESKKASLDSEKEDGEDQSMVNVNDLESERTRLDSAHPITQLSKNAFIEGQIQKRKKARPNQSQENLNPSEDRDLALLLQQAPSELRRSTRNANAKINPTPNLVTPRKLSSKRKSAQKRILLQVKLFSQLSHAEKTIDRNLG